jgi:phage gp36-like protein
VSYLDVAAFRVRTIMPNEQVDQLLTLSPGWLEAQLESVSSWIDMYLAKRYTVPFRAPYPRMVTAWLARIVTATAYASHGFPASDQQREAIDADARRAEEEVRQAADGNLGLIDLAPSDQSISPVMYGGTRVYSETSPYVGFDIQRSRGRREDSNGHGS